MSDAGASSAEAPRGRGRPRSEEADRALLAAASELLTERRPGDVSMEAIAARAGVSKATLYRRWSSLEELGLATLEEMAAESGPVGDLGDTRTELVAAVGGTIERLSDTSMGRVIQCFTSTWITDPALHTRFRERVIEVRREDLGQILERGVARGDLRPDLDADLAADLLLGPVYHRLVLSGERLDPSLAGRIVDAVLEGWAVRDLAALAG
jgi:AcrR family transcriptional regulator